MRTKPITFLTDERTIARFWSRVDQSAGPAACWPWRGARYVSGYGKLMHQWCYFLAHRVAYTIAHGPIPEGLTVLHECDNPICCNPAHLRAGTQTENLEDMRTKGRGRNGPRLGEAHHKAKLTDDQVRQIRARCDAGELHRVVAADFGLNRATVSQIARRAGWRHVA